MASISRIRRLLNILELLQSGRPFSGPELAEHCGVSRRTVFRYIRQLQDAGVQIIYDDKRQGYMLYGGRFLTPTDFTLDEVLALIVMCGSMAKSGHGIPFHRSALTAVSKLQSKLPGHLREDLGDLSESIEIRFDQRHPLEDAEQHFQLLRQAISGRRKIRVQYSSTVEEEPDFTTLLSPYRVMFSRRSWYVIGYSSKHRGTRLFHVGRIKQAKLIEQNYEIPPRFSMERFLGNAWHIMKGEQTYEVVIRFAPKVAQNVSEVNWHRTQRIDDLEDGSIEFRVTVDGLDEISWWVLGYGDQATVIEPTELREIIARHVRSMVKQYTGD